MTDIKTVEKNFREFAAKTWPDNQRFKIKKERAPLKRSVSRTSEQAQIKQLKKENKKLRKKLKNAYREIEFFVECEQGVVNTFQEFHQGKFK